MPIRERSVHVLVIRFWIHDAAMIRESVRAAGFHAHIRRVDIEPALHAALGRQPWDLVIYDPSTPELSLDTTRRLMTAFRRRAPIVILDDVETLADRVRQALHDRRS